MVPPATMQGSRNNLGKRCCDILATSRSTAQNDRSEGGGRGGFLDHLICHRCQAGHRHAASQRVPGFLSTSVADLIKSRRGSGDSPSWPDCDTRCCCWLAQKSSPRVWWDEKIILGKLKQKRDTKKWAEIMELTQLQVDRRQSFRLQRGTVNERLVKISLRSLLNGKAEVLNRADSDWTKTKYSARGRQDGTVNHSATRGICIHVPICHP